MVLIVLIAFVSIAHAQRSAVVFAKDGNGFYQIQQNEIVFTELPSMNKKTWIDKTKLIPEGANRPIGIKSFQVSEDGSKLLIYNNSKKVWRYETRGDYWMFDTKSNTLKQLGKGRPASSLMFAKFSPDGNYVAYVSGHNVYVEEVNTNIIKQLTTDGTAKLINGTFDWAYEEEFGCRDGFRWSSDSKSIAFWQIDATAIRNFLMINNTDSMYAFTVPVEYPKVGEDPSACKIGVVNIHSGNIQWMKVPGDEKQHYIPRMEWVPNQNKLILQQLNRKQNESKIMLCDAVNGKTTTVFTESDKAWIDIKSRWNNDDPTGWEWINSNNDFIWISEKDGWRHAYVIGLDGKETLITKEAFDIISLKGIDAVNGMIYFTASPDNATEQYLYKISLSGKAKAERLTPSEMKGTNNYTVAPGCKFAQHNFSNVVSNPQQSWVSLPQHQYIGKKPSVNTDYKGIEFIQVTTDDNVTLDGYIIKPKNFDSTKKYPVVFYVYAEPGATTVNNRYGEAGNFLYNGDMQADGYIQISLDNRGTPAPKGAAWRKSIYRNIGQLNIRDQAMAAKKILEWKYIDKSRVAVWGWSGGGSTTLNLLFQYPEIYQTGISIAPVTNMLSYDNIYEERYMGVPWESKEDYIKGSPITYAKNLKGNLLLIHGTGDDNVHYQNTELLINELIQQNKVFQFMSYPNRSHSLSEGGPATFMHLSNLYTDFLKKHCAPGGR